MLDDRLKDTPADSEDYPGLLNLVMERNRNQLHECLSDGFVRLVDVMGDDNAIVQAARVSYGAGTKKVSDDRNLIRYLMRNAHTSPFEMVEFKFHIRVPMDCWRQWIRHRTANVNEYSTRYSEAIDSADKTGVWRLQSTNNKQGSTGILEAWPEGWERDEKTRSIKGPDTHHKWSVRYKHLMPETPSQYLTEREAEFLSSARRLYEERLSMGIAREQARKDLPLSTYTEAYWKIDLHNLFHFLRLRIDKHAQKEIREYGEAMYKLIQPHVPLSCEAFQDYRVQAVTFSGPELEIVKALLGNFDNFKHRLSEREIIEFNSKVRDIGLRITARKEYAELD